MLLKYVNMKLTKNKNKGRVMVRDSRKALIGLVVIVCTVLTYALDNGLVRTPPMGWNSWNCFGANIDEAKIKGVADAMVTSGLRDAGYIYLNLDDNWMAKSRDANGNLQGDPTRFPKGMKELGDYIHSKGLKFGIYGDRGTVTCYFRDNFKELTTQSGSAGKEVQDAKTFASWGVDYLKYDNCEVGYAAPAATMQKDYTAMRDALANSGRDIVFSICAWEFKEWMPEVGNLWRTTTDILNHWKKEGGDWSWGILDIVDQNEKYAQYAKPGAWNDPDMLQVGNFGGNRAPTATEYRSHMSLWCIMAAPIIMGNDIRNMNQETKDILLNKEVIAINQDSAGIQGERVKESNGLEVWCKPLGSRISTTKAVALFNRNSSTSDITVNFSDIGISGTVYVRDLWAKSDKGAFTGSFTMSVPSHGTALLKLTGEPPKPRSAFEKIEAESFNSQEGIQTESNSEDGDCVGFIQNGDYVIYSNLDFGEGANGVQVRTGSENSDGTIEFRLDSLKGQLVGSCKIENTGEWHTWAVQDVKTETITGKHDLYVKFVSETDEFLGNIDWLIFLNDVKTQKRKTQILSYNFKTEISNGNFVFSPLNNKNKYGVSLYSPNGRLVFRKNNISAVERIPLFTKGIYIVNVQSGDVNLGRRAVINY